VLDSRVLRYSLSTPPHLTPIASSPYCRVVASLHEIVTVMTRPGNAIFPENRPSIDALISQSGQFVASSHAMGTDWHPPTDSIQAGLRVLITQTGHAIVYGPHGQRILYTDPGGHPLHECAWYDTGTGPKLLYARLYLDWGQWVGIKPEGLVNVGTLDLSKKPGWQRLTTKDLQMMAAQALRVTPEEIAFFYDDRSMTIDAQGRVTIRHRKDALYILEDGTFAQSRFMACMGAMHWGHIDFLPVVELFQSLLPGTGSATFELIRGLYDDQTLDETPRPLRYRGIPTYPSPQAYQLFSAYFVPEAPSGADPFPLFMEPSRSSEVIWKPRPDVPRRYLDFAQGVCVTVIGGAVQKVTKLNDPVAIPFTRPKKAGSATGGRMVGATKTSLQLQDDDQREEFSLRPEWDVTKAEPLSERTASPVPTWRALFPDGVPALDTKRAYCAVPFYPDDETMVDEVATLSLVVEQSLECLNRVAAARKGAAAFKSALIHNWDAVLAECLDLAQDRDYTVLYTRPEFAQRQAQRVWDQAAAAGTLANLRRIVFRDAARHQEAAYAKSYGLIYGWVPFDQYRLRTDCERQLGAVSKALTPEGAAIMVGPAWLGEVCPRVSLRVRVADPVADMPGVRMHRAILPKARVNPEATLFLMQKA